MSRLQERSPEVVTFGETMVLMSPMSDGPLSYVHTFQKHIGGAESNVCIGLLRLGRTAGWISRLGDDEFGRYVLRQIRGEGVDTSRVKFDPTFQTGLYFKERRSAPGGQVYYYRKDSAASRMDESDLDPEYIAGAKYLLVTGITPALSASCKRMTERAIEIAKDAGVKVVFDPNIRFKLWAEEEARSTLLSLARKADIFLPGDTEAEFLTGERDPMKAGKILSELGPHTVVVKIGAEGAIVFSKDDDDAGRNGVIVPGFEVERVVDPVGAGDAFLAGFLTGLLEGKLPIEAARIGNACGAMAVTVSGDVEGLPDRNEVERMLSDHSTPDVLR